MKLNHNIFILSAIISAIPVTFSCNDRDKIDPEIEPIRYLTDEEVKVMTYAGGELGTTFVTSSYAYQQATPATENAGMSIPFKYGETIFERDFVQTEGTPFSGLGPLMVRNGCLYCHPAYGHGKRQTRYRASDMGNGYLLVIYDKSTDAYVTSLTGMPQTLAVKPFKAPIDEKQISIEWLSYTDEWGNRFPDGETYQLIYPEVTIPETAYYVPLQATRNGQTVNLDASQVGIRLESTIGIYGTGLLDAIAEDDITAQWKEESAHAELNPAYWDAAAGNWKSLYSTGLDKKPYVRRFTYALSRGPLQDGAGANAIWNITNVTRSDRRYNYMTACYADVASKDPEVQAQFYDYFPKERTDKGIEYDIKRYLTGKENGQNIAPAEMSDEDYRNLMIWHRGLAVPAARDLDEPQVQLGMKLFNEIGCAACHRPSWKTGSDEIQDPNGMLSNSDMPRYPHQTIWPYTDMVQHRLFMENDIRTGWCRTTPLWGRGLSKLCTGAEDRMHDCRARNTMEAIMWHGNSKSDARKSVENFRELSREERDAVIRFIESI